MSEEVNRYPYTKNRELSWLMFNKRVLEEAGDRSVPLLERLKFIEIFTSNLDEFYMIRVGSLTDMTLVEEERTHIDNKSGMTPAEQLNEIFKACRPLYKQRDREFAEIEGELRTCNVCRLHVSEMGRETKIRVEEWFQNYIKPVLSPQIIDIHHPFPHLISKALNIILYIDIDGRKTFGIIPIPETLPRVLYSDARTGLRYMLIEDIILYYAEEVFDKVTVLDKAVFSITRNADISPEDEAFDVDEDFRDVMTKVIRKRKRLEPVRVEIQSSHREMKDVESALKFSGGKNSGSSKNIKNKGGKNAKGDAAQVPAESNRKDKIIEFLVKKLGLQKKQVFITNAPLSLKYVYELEGKLTPESAAALCYTSYTPRNTSGPLGLDMTKKLIPQVLKHDVLLHYPYESMDPFLQLIREASQDEDVAAIRITIYRLASKTRLVDYLCSAAENGKEVTVLMELRARFDEQNNIHWAERLEEAGCTILYGIDDIKVHSKLCLISRRNGDKIEYITQIGTGNYNEKTAKMYVDLCLITSDQVIGADAASVFRNLALNNLGVVYNKLIASPYRLREKCLEMMDEEIGKGADGYIFLKLNSLTDRIVIDKLEEASKAGVEIVLNIRGICCLRPGIDGHTENIRVFSIVGRFLEHTRIYRFGRGDDAALYISSADFMTRNLERRVEIGCPVEDEAARAKIFWIIDTYLSDNVKARYMNADGTYHRVQDMNAGSRPCDKPRDGISASVSKENMSGRLLTADIEEAKRNTRGLRTNAVRTLQAAPSTGVCAQEIFMKEDPEFLRKEAENAEAPLPAHTADNDGGLSGSSGVTDADKEAASGEGTRGNNAHFSTEDADSFLSRILSIFTGKK